MNSLSLNPSHSKLQTHWFKNFFFLFLAIWHFSCVLFYTYILGRLVISSACYQYLDGEEE